MNLNLDSMTDMSTRVDTSGSACAPGEMLRFEERLQQLASWIELAFELEPMSFHFSTVRVFAAQPETTLVPDIALIDNSGPAAELFSFKLCFVTWLKKLSIAASGSRRQLVLLGYVVSGCGCRVLGFSSFEGHRVSTISRCGSLVASIYLVYMLQEGYGK